MHGEPALWSQLMDRLADLAITSLESQVHAGAQAVQLFDSWAGALTPRDYEQFVLPASAKVFAAIADLGVPRIHFGVGTGELLGLMSAAGADVVGVDWRVPLSNARTRVGGKPLQGNLDPALCLAPWPVVAAGTREVMAQGGGVTGGGHVFNLGHGVFPETDPGILTAVVDLVHAESQAG
jgi:uroporphyrinogen decarboxylase